jgi:hypothetical protein
VHCNIDRVLNACVAHFVHVADDVRENAGTTTHDAMLRALTYFGNPGPS